MKTWCGDTKATGQFWSLGQGGAGERRADFFCIRVEPDLGVIPAEDLPVEKTVRRGSVFGFGTAAEDDLQAQPPAGKTGR